MSSLTPNMVEALTCLKDWEAAETRQQHQLEDQEIANAMADLEFEDED
uniref:HAT C-terminal dimerisation domain-containing protein n=1 Tax=Arundo donax TaxID=35708 RepID=A0A0A9AR42_ARUDO